MQHSAAAAGATLCCCGGLPGQARLACSLVCLRAASQRLVASLSCTPLWTCCATDHFVFVQVGKLIYCTRTVPEMEKVLAELQVGCACPRTELLGP